MFFFVIGDIQIRNDDDNDERDTLRGLLIIVQDKTNNQVTGQSEPEMPLACPNDLRVIRLKHFHEDSIYDKVQRTNIRRVQTASL